MADVTIRGGAVEAAADEAVSTVAVWLQAATMTSHVVGFGRRYGDLAESYVSIPVKPGHWQVISQGIFYQLFVEAGTRYMAAQRHLMRAGEAAAAAFGGTFKGDY